MTINLRVKVGENAIMPMKATDGSAGIDIATSHAYVIYPTDEGYFAKISTQLFFQIPKNHVGLLIERSSLHLKGLTLANSIGVIDSDYRGELLISVKNITNNNIRLEKGQKIAQLLIVPVPEISLINVSKLNETTRGSGGFGSTGN